MIKIDIPNWHMAAGSGKREGKEGEGGLGNGQRKC